MNNDEQNWQAFLDSHEDFLKEFSEDDVDGTHVTEQQFGMTLFSGEPDGYFMVFNTQIDIFQFARLLRYFFGVEGIDIGHADWGDHHFHNMNEDDETDDD